jgi:hypothetical protein
MGSGLEDRRSAGAPLPWPRRRSDFDTLLAMAHTICRHERMTLGTADDMRAGGIAGR